jgi:hypothetical protein
VAPETLLLLKPPPFCERIKICLKIVEDETLERLDRETHENEKEKCEQAD